MSLYSGFRNTYGVCAGGGGGPMTPNKMQAGLFLGRWWYVDDGLASLKYPHVVTMSN
jgi:hypothetical protein